MTTEQRISDYLASQPQPKRGELEALQRLVLERAPEPKLWFLDGMDANGKVVSNPSIGYGSYTITYADGSSKEFYRIGLSATTSGISVYIMGLPDKTYLPATYGATIGKAKVSGYCIAFKELGDIDLAVLREIIEYRWQLAA